MKEHDIISGCKQGNRLAQKYFVETYSSYIYTICRRYISREDIAKDCLQDTLIHILKKINKYSEEGKFKGWVSRVTVNKCIECIRREKRNVFTGVDLLPEQAMNEKITLKLEHDDVMKFINTIPMQYRVVINMFLVEGYSHKEIAEHLDVSESSSRSMLSRAKKMINESFKNESFLVIHKDKAGINKKISS